MGPASGATRVAVMGVCLDAMSYNALSHFVVPLPGAAAVGNVERYGGAEREAARMLETGHTRVCIIDYDQNTEEAVWVTERLKNEHPDIYVFAVSTYAQPDRIIAAMRAGCAEYLMKPLQSERVLDALSRVEANQR